MDKLTVIKRAAQIVKYCNDSVCESCLFYKEKNENNKCMWMERPPYRFKLEDIITKWSDENE